MTLKVSRTLICDWCGVEMKASKYVGGLDMCMKCIDGNHVVVTVA